MILKRLKESFEITRLAEDTFAVTSFVKPTVTLTRLELLSLADELKGLANADIPPLREGRIGYVQDDKTIPFNKVAEGYGYYVTIKDSAIFFETVDGKLTPANWITLSFRDIKGYLDSGAWAYVDAKI